MGQSDVDGREIHSTIEAFEAASTAQTTLLPEVSLRRILLVLDGSNQDQTSEAFARILARRENSELQLLWAYAGETIAEREGYLRQRSRAIQQEDDLVAGILDRGENRAKRPVEQILEIMPTFDLAVVCAPYQEDFSELGQQSVGSVLDILMARAPGPVLAVREPKEDPQKCLRQTLLPLTPVLETSALAASWALYLGRQGDVQLFAITPAPPQGNEDAPQKVAAALRRPDVAGLVAAVQRRAAEEDTECRVELRLGEGLELLAEAVNEQDQVVVVPCCPRDPEKAAYQRVQALLRVSRNPLLVV